MAAPGTAQHMQKHPKGAGDKKAVPEPIHGHGHHEQLGHKHAPETPRRHTHRSK